jgi:hypothetical protein
MGDHNGMLASGATTPPSRSGRDGTVATIVPSSLQLAERAAFIASIVDSAKYAP